MIASADGSHGVVIMTNGAGGGRLCDELIHGLAYAYDWPEFKPDEKVMIRLDRLSLKSLTGHYRTLDAIGLRLDVAFDEPSGLPVPKCPLLGFDYKLHPQSESQYFTREVPALIRLHRSAGQGIRAIDFEGRGMWRFTAAKVE